MISNDRKAMRYAARLTAIYDFVSSGIMDRDYNSLNRAECLDALSKIKRLPETKELYNLWSQVSNEFPGIGNTDVEAITTWSVQGAYKYYDIQKREIETVLCLRELYDKAGGDLFGISERNNVYCWTLKGWTTFQKRITWYLVLAMEELKATGNIFTIDDALQKMAQTKRKYTEEQKVKK